MHKHHVIPRFLGGLDTPDNIVDISAMEHFRAHYDAWKDTGDIRHLFSCGLLQRNHIMLSDEERRVICSAAGKVGGKIQFENKIGIHAQTPEERLIIASMGGKNGAFQVECIMREGYTKSQAEDIHKKRQSDRGKRGGVKNKGFVWINDGTIDLKYTVSMQRDISVEEFILQNPQYKTGRMAKNVPIELLTCPHCGKIGGSYPAMRQHHFDRCKHKE